MHVHQPLCVAVSSQLDNSIWFCAQSDFFRIFLGQSPFFRIFFPGSPFSENFFSNCQKKVRFRFFRVWKTGPRKKRQDCLFQILKKKSGLLLHDFNPPVDGRKRLSFYRSNHAHYLTFNHFVKNLASIAFVRSFILSTTNYVPITTCPARWLPFFYLLFYAFLSSMHQKLIKNHLFPPSTQ